MAQTREKSHYSDGDICPGCSSKYFFKTNLNRKIARIIPECNHNLCEQCIVTEGTSTGQVCCRHSNCSTKVVWTGRIEKFVPNIFIFGRIAYLQQLQSVVPGEDEVEKIATNPEPQDENLDVMCGECEEKTADCFCQNCDTSLCSPCFESIHKYAKSLMKHKKLPVQLNSTGRKILQLVKIKDCTDHMKPIKYVADSGAMGCEECVIIGKMKGLEVISVESYNQGKRRDLEEKLSEGKSKLDRLNLLLADKYEELASKIKSHMTDCHSQLQILEHDLCQKLESHHEAAKTEKEQSTKIISEKINEASNFLKIAEEAVSKDCGSATYNFSQMAEYVADLDGLFALIGNNGAHPLKLDMEVDPTFLNLLRNHIDLIETEVSEVREEVPSEDRIDTVQQIFPNISMRLINSLEAGERAEKNIILSQEEGVSDLDTIPVKETSVKTTTHSQNSFKSQNEQASKDLSEQIKKDDEDNSLQYRVSHLESPSRIYVVSSNDTKRESRITDGLSDFFSKHSSHNPTHWSVGDHCAAKQDSYTWGRAEIINLSHSDTDASLVATLFFYDNGKIEEIPGGCLRTLPKQMKLDPPLAKQVHLSDIRPTGGTHRWSKSTCESLKKIVDEGEEFVRLIDDGERVVDEMVGVNSLPVKLMMWEERDTGPFSPVDREEVSISQKLKDEGLALPTDDSKIVKKALLVPENFGHKFRPMSTILESAESISSKALECEGSTSSGAVESISSQATDRNGGMDILDDVKEDGASGYGMGIHNNVEEEAASNQSLGSNTPHTEGFMWTSPSLLQEKQFIGTPTHVDWDCTIYIQTAENKSKAGKIQQLLNSKYCESCSAPCDLYWFAGQACIVQFEVDNNWCRGRVVQAVQTGVFEVEFVDYGNREEIKPNQMRKELFCREEPIQCFKFQLVDVVPKSPDGKWSQVVLEFIHKLVVEKNIHVSILSGLEEGFPVKGKLTDGQVDISELLVENGYAEWAVGFSQSIGVNQSQESLPSFLHERSFVTNDSFDDSLSKCDDNITDATHDDCYRQQELVPNFSVGDNFPVMVLGILDPDVVCCKVVPNLEKDLEFFKEMMEKLQISGDQEQAVVDPGVGLLVIARFSEDRKWYRAVVIKKSPLFVLFVDYGNTEETEEVRYLPAGVEELPQQAVFLQTVPELDLNHPELISPEGYYRCRLLKLYQEVPSGSRKPVAFVQFINWSQK